MAIHVNGARYVSYEYAARSAVPGRYVCNINVQPQRLVLRYPHHLKALLTIVGVRICGYVGIYQRISKRKGARSYAGYNAILVLAGGGAFLSIHGLTSHAVTVCVGIAGV